MLKSYNVSRKTVPHIGKMVCKRYFCDVFFIVLDLRLKGWDTAVSLFLCP